MADPLSIIGTALALTSAITQVVGSVERFTRHVRDARKEMDEIHRELGSLKLATDNLRVDLERPSVIEPNGLSEIFKNCDQVINQLDTTLRKYDRERLSGQVRYVWKGKETIETYRRILVAHNSALNLAIGYMDLTISRGIQGDVRELRDNSSELRIGVNHVQNVTGEIKNDTEQILNQIAELQARLPAEYQMPVQNRLVDENANYMLGKYLSSLAEDVESVASVFDTGRRSESSSLRADDESTAQHGDFRIPGAFPGPYRQRQTFNRTMEPTTPFAKSTNSVAGPSRTGTSRTAASKTATFRTAPSRIASAMVAPLNTTAPETPTPTTTTNIEIQAKFMRAGLETQSHKDWRVQVERAMRKIPDEEIGPSNGISYERDIDYKIKNYGFHNKMTGIKNKYSSMGNDVKSRALAIKWMRRFTMDGNCINYGVCCGASLTGSGELWISPLMVAIEMHDVPWTNYLLESNAMPSDFTYRLGPSWAGTYLALLLDWNLSIFKSLLERIVSRRPSSLNRLRGDALRHVSRKPSEDEPLAIMAAEQQRDHPFSTKDLEAWRLHAAELLLSNGPRMEADALEGFLQAAVEARAKGMIQLLIKYNIDLNYISIHGYGTILHYAIQEEAWDMIRFLHDIGADLNIKAELCRYWLQSFRQTLTPIEFAGYKGRLKRFNETLGTQHKDTRSVGSKWASNINRWL